jgi:predicted nucleotidyltransferase
MEHKDYNLEIVLLLLKEKGHIRGMAKKLGTNHTTIARKIRALLKENVVDFTPEGKNKTFFLKKTAEARALVCMAEHYKLLRTLREYPGLRAIIDKIALDKRIRLALLFGSYAKGTATKESDIDVYLETNDLKIKKALQMVDSKLSIKVGKYNKEDNLIKEIENNHVVIKGAEEYYDAFFGKA